MRERCRSITPTYLFLKGARDGMWFSHLYHSVLTPCVVILISPAMHGGLVGTMCCKNSAFPNLFPLVWSRVGDSPDRLMTAHLALLARRAYVFPPHIARDHRPFIDIANLAIPFSTFTYGPITGAPFAWSRGSANESSLAEDKIIPRAVSEEYFHSVCSEEQTVVLSVEEISRELGIDVDSGSALTTMIAWGKKLAEMEQPCVDVRGRAVFLYT